MAGVNSSLGRSPFEITLRRTSPSNICEESTWQRDFKAEAFSRETLASQTEPASSLTACRGVAEARISPCRMIAIWLQRLETSETI